MKLRFAPSPTGNLHIGNARTLILNYIYSRSRSGEMLLRIDDTDSQRSDEKYTKSIIQDIEWLDINCVETHRQSTRIERYREISKYLISKDRLYPCYESDEELNRIRKLNLSRGKPPIYDRAALQLSKAQIDNYKSDGRKPYWRFLLDHHDIFWSDLIRGHQKIDCSSFSDPVLIRADGSYLYSLPSVTDDIDMGITDVLRGEDHVSNTATQIQIFQALGEKVPNFGHHSLMVLKDGSRMSKRDGAMSLSDIRSSGIEPMTVMNYCARIGTSDSIEPYQKIDELASTYDLSKLSRAPARFGFDELEALNKKLLQNKSFETVKDRLSEMGISDDNAKNFWNTIRTNINTIDEIKSWKDIIENDFEIDSIDKKLIQDAHDLLPNDPWDKNTWKSWTDLLSQKTGLTGKNLFLPLRIALTGRESGPELALFIILLGREKLLNRLKLHLGKVK